MITNFDFLQFVIEFAKIVDDLFEQIHRHHTSFEVRLFHRRIVGLKTKAAFEVTQAGHIDMSRKRRFQGNLILKPHFGGGVDSRLNNRRHVCITHKFILFSVPSFKASTRHRESIPYPPGSSPAWRNQLHSVFRTTETTTLSNDKSTLISFTKVPN
ncbi:MAG TPA: hypothetical protein VIN96_02330 [Magnetovibrio sp.]